MDIKKTVVLGTFAGTAEKIGRYHSPLHVKVEIQWGRDDLNPDKKLPRLSICGETYRPGRRDCESGGQITDEVRRLLADPGARLNYPREQIARLLEVWERWHLNDMRSGCEHQRATWNPLEKIEVVTYYLTTDVYVQRRKIEATAVERLQRGETVTLASGDAALLALPATVVQDSTQPAPGPAYEVERREEKAAGWVYPKESSRGLLCRPCEVCGYKYGSAWLYEPVPDDVVKFLEDF